MLKLSNEMKILLKHKELINNLVIKELKVKYKHSALGFFWSLMNPLLMLVIYTFAFKIIMKIEIENFPVFLLAGLLPWTFFQASIMMGTNSIINAGGLISKVYFPRKIIPLSLTLANFINFLMTIIILLFAAFIVFRLNISSLILLLPLILILLLGFTFGVVLVLSSLNVYYRDISYFVEVVSALWFYLTPIIYSIEMIPENIRWIAYVNPLTPYIQLIRATIFSDVGNIYNMLLISFVWSMASLLIGVGTFNKHEKNFSEMI